MSRTGWSCWTLPSPCTPRRCSLSPGTHAAAAALARPSAAAAVPSPWQSPGYAQKAPASGLCLHFLLHQMTRCCRRYLFVVSVPLRAFARFSPGVWGRRWELREAEGRPERTDRSSSPPSPGSHSSAQGCDLGTRAAPLRPACSPHSGLPPSQRHFEQPGQRRRETDRQSDLPLFPPPQLRSAHTKEEEETRELRGWFSCLGLDSSCARG